MKRPNDEQLAALTVFAVKHGDQWKRKLSDMWMTGADANQPSGHLLRQVRNQLGPRWLSSFKLQG